MPRRRKMKGGATASISGIGGINAPYRSSVMFRPNVSTPSATMSTWDKIKNFAKQHKLISRGLSAIGGMVGDKYKPIFDAGSGIASSYGYGKRKYKKQMGCAKSNVLRF